jgi:hypothetical protein
MDGSRQLSDSRFVERRLSLKRSGAVKMFNLILGLALIGLMITPAIVAGKSGRNLTRRPRK